MKRYAKIFVSCLLTFTMVFTSVQWSAIVNETTVVGAAETVPKEKKEVVEGMKFMLRQSLIRTLFYQNDKLKKNSAAKIEQICQETEK